MTHPHARTRRHWSSVFRPQLGTVLEGFRHTFGLVYVCFTLHADVSRQLSYCAKPVRFVFERLRWCAFMSGEVEHNHTASPLAPLLGDFCTGRYDAWLHILRCPCSVLTRLSLQSYSTSRGSRKQPRRQTTRLRYALAYNTLPRQRPLIIGLM